MSLCTGGVSGAEETAIGVVIFWFYQTQYIAMGGTGVVCEEEGQVFEDVYRLSDVESGYSEK